MVGLLTFSPQFFGTLRLRTGVSSLVLAAFLASSALSAQEIVPAASDSVLLNDPTRPPTYVPNGEENGAFGGTNLQATVRHGGKRAWALINGQVYHVGDELPFMAQARLVRIEEDRVVIRDTAGQITSLELTPRVRTAAPQRKIKRSPAAQQLTPATTQSTAKQLMKQPTAITPGAVGAQTQPTQAR